MNQLVSERKTLDEYSLTAKLETQYHILEKGNIW